MYLCQSFGSKLTQTTSKQQKGQHSDSYKRSSTAQHHMLASKQLQPPQLSGHGTCRSIRCFVRRSAVPRHARRPATALRVLAAAGTKSSKPTPSTAKAAVEAGLQEFQQSKDYNEAVRLFKAAMDLQPSSEEAAAALFNLGCAYAKLRNFRGASEAIGTAINEHNLKLTVALQDDDLRELRDTREWLDMMATVKGGMTREQKVLLRAEARAPFRFARITLFGGLAIGAALGLFVITGRLILSIKGGPGAPALEESLTNFGINSAAVAVLGFLVYRDLQAQKKATSVTKREEELSRLLIKLGANRVLPLIRFRGAVRPVIIAGDRSYVERCIKEGERSKDALRQRGVSVIPVIYSSRDDPEDKLRALKRSLQQQDSTAKGFGSSSSSSSSSGGQQFQPGASGSGIGNSEVSLTEGDKKWRLEATAVEEWEAWIEAQKEFAGVDASKRNVWIQVQLDGTVRSSGAGTPPWEKFVGDLPPLDSVRTQMTDGIGPSI